MHKAVTSEFMDKAKCNVYLRDGTEYLGKDPCPPGTNMNFISFWDEGGLIIIPNDLIKRIEVYQDK